MEWSEMVTVTCTQVCMETYTHNERWGGGDTGGYTHKADKGGG